MSREVFRLLKLSERDRWERERQKISVRVEINYKMVLKRLPHVQKPGNWPLRYST